MAVAIDANALLLKSSVLGESSGTLIEVDIARAGWEFTGLTVVKLGSGERWSRETGSDEVALVPLGGRCTIVSDGQSWTIGERTNPFAGQPWAVYLPRDSAFEVAAETALELAVCAARAERRSRRSWLRPRM